MKLISNDFKHLDDLPKEFSYQGGNISPSLQWYDFNPTNVGAFVIIMTSNKTNNIHWYTLCDKNTTRLELNSQTGYERQIYVGPNDVNELVIYTITVYAISNPNVQYPDIINPQNVVDKAYIKFLYDGFKN